MDYPQFHELNIVSFLSSLLPSTHETVQHVLSRGGFGSSAPRLSSTLMGLELPDRGDVAEGSQPRQPSHTSHPSMSMHGPQFDALLDETRNILASPDFAYVLEKCLDRATGVLCAGIEASVFGCSDGPPGGEDRIRLAALLPDLARWSQTVLGGLPNELIDVRTYFSILVFHFS
jgi:peroxin-3